MILKFVNLMKYNMRDILKPNPLGILHLKTDAWNQWASKVFG